MHLAAMCVHINARYLYVSMYARSMFRLADIQPRTVIDPRVRITLFTWGPGRRTAEGEPLPVQAAELRVTAIDRSLLLPVTVEHLIDESSPLHGHTLQSLEVRGQQTGRSIYMYIYVQLFASYSLTAILSLSTGSDHHALLQIGCQTRRLLMLVYRCIHP